ncbi:DUF680 domain-containing protein [Mesorhizobium cantuariense]|uniref:DUF680 domain-containing protein n=1 Tax=Mesorhizobium cantuariense TaxID=1300275 RepID=A0ABV7MXN9_9HYPH
MNKIALAAAAILIATATAFGGSDKYGSNDASQPTVMVDHTATTSISKSTASAQAPQGADLNLFGR